MKIIGYILALVGLASILLSSVKFHSSISLIEKLPSKYMLIGGAVLVILGILFLVSKGGSGSSKIKHASEEVPIYEGEGKKRKIVGYQRSK
jgi:hypothetical protein